MTERRDGPGGRLQATLTRVAIATLLASLILFIAFPDGGLTVKLFRNHDFSLLLLGAAVLMALALRPRALTVANLPRPALLAAVLTVAVLVVTGAGTWLVFGDFPLVRDEILADFDAAFLARGALIAPMPPEWQPFATALMPKFMLPVASSTGWLSAYLPGNAALRALGELTVGMEWTNPILAAVSILAVYRVGRRLWPDTPRTALAAALLMGTSAQFITMAMTAYAMSAHLAFNLIWLWCFLRGDRKGDAGALIAGFIATGLHQLLFHPLFVAPFLAHLWLTGERRRAIVYAFAYLAIGLFWASYWQIVLSGSGVAGDQASASGMDYLFARLSVLLGAFKLTSFTEMAFNVLRFLSWQNVVLLPLALLAWPAIRRGEGIARPLAAGVLLTLAVMLVLLPWQGLGWGYRYLHGFIGSFCLLAGYGWNSLAGEARQRRAALAAGTAASLLLILPVHLKQAHDYVAPVRRAHAMIGRSPADLVIVDPAFDIFDDLVRNAPDLSNRPKIMDGGRLDAAQIRFLCGRYRVEIFDIEDGVRVGLPRIIPPGLAQRPPSAVRQACGAPPSQVRAP